MARKTRAQARVRRHLRVRANIGPGTADRPRLSVFRSLNETYAQLIDDGTGSTLASASTRDPELKKRLKGLKKTDAARIVGQVVAERAREKGIGSAIFDRGGYRYHGRVRALAEAAREAGLKF